MDATATDQEPAMPELLNDGLPERARRSKFDFSEWADGRAWQFVKGQDYSSSSDTFRSHIRRWAKANGLEVDVRLVPATGRDGHVVPLTKQDAIAVAVQFAARNGNGTRSGDDGT
jgi:hypothetical protein